MSMKPFSIIVAMDERNGIGKNGGLAWHLSADLKYFKELTTRTSGPGKINAVIMGRKTWDSLPEKYKPLPGRPNIVLTTQKGIVFPSGVLSFSSLDEALKKINQLSEIEHVFMIGGAQVFNQTIDHPACRRLYVTHLKGDFACDTFFPVPPASFKLVKESPWLCENAISYRFCQYQKT